MQSSTLTRRRPLVRLSLALLALTLLFAGCEANLTPEQMLTKSLSSIGSLKSYESKTNLTFTIEALGGKIDTQVDNQSTVFLSPYRSAAVTNLSMGDMVTQVNSYTQEFEGKLVQHAYANETWMHEEVVLDNIDASQQMKIYLDNAQSFALVGDEPVTLTLKENDVDAGTIEYDAVHVQGQLKGASLDTALRAQFEAMQLPLPEGGDLGALAVDLWIEKGTHRPVKMRMDMSDIIGGILSGGADQGISVSAIMEMTMFHFDEASDFEVPEAALTDYAKQAK